MRDITDCTDRVLDIFLRSIGGEDGIDCEALTTTERRQLAELHGWESSAYLSAWIAEAPVETPDCADYEGAILDRQDREVGDYL